MLEKVNEWVFTIGLFLVVMCAVCIMSKLAYDVWRTPNMFTKEEAVLEQKKIDDMCVKWWFDSDLTAAKKRVCGK